MGALSLPHALRYLTVGYAFVQMTHGRSSSNVYRLEGYGREALFLKVAPPAESALLQGEAERLRWLAGKAPVPEFIDFAEDSRGAYLLMSAVIGTPLIAFNNADQMLQQEMVVLLGNALATLHATEIGMSFPSNPVEGVPPRSLEVEFEPLEGRQAEILRGLQARWPLAQRVFVHGDPCLPNVLVRDGELAGFVDLGGAGVGDPFKDLALALWSLEYNYGVGWEDALLGAYLGRPGSTAGSSRGR